MRTTRLWGIGTECRYPFSSWRRTDRVLSTCESSALTVSITSGNKSTHCFCSANLSVYPGLGRQPPVQGPRPWATALRQSTMPIVILFFNAKGPVDLQCARVSNMTNGQDFSNTRITMIHAFSQDMRLNMTKLLWRHLWPIFSIMV